MQESYEDICNKKLFITQHLYQVEISYNSEIKIQSYILGSWIANTECFSISVWHLAQIVWELPTKWVSTTSDIGGSSGGWWAALLASTSRYISKAIESTSFHQWPHALHFSCWKAIRMHCFSFEGEQSAVVMLSKVGLSMSGKGRGLEALGSGGIDPAPAGGALEPGMHTGKCSVKMPPDEVACSTQCPRFFRASVVSGQTGCWGSGMRYTTLSPREWYRGNNEAWQSATSSLQPCAQ